MIAALSKLKWLVVVEIYEIETATFWKAPKEYGGAGRRRRSRPRSTSSRPPASPRRTGRSRTRRAGCSGSGRRSIRRARPKTDQEILARIFLAVRDLYKKEGGALPEQVLNVDLELHEPGRARPRRGPEGDQRQGARRHPRSEGQDQDAQDRGPAARRLRPAPGRRLDDVRQLAALGRLHRGRQQRRSAARPRIRPASACSTTGPSPGPPTAASCTTARRPTREGKAWDPDAPGHRLERREVGRRRPGHQARLASRRVRRVHHERRRASAGSSRRP